MIKPHLFEQAICFHPASGAEPTLSGQVVVYVTLNILDSNICHLKSWKRRC